MAKKDSATARPPRMKIKKGDHVVVVAGRDRGREGTVILADPERQRVLVQGVNMVHKSKKVDYQGARGAKEGGILEQLFFSLTQGEYAGANLGPRWWGQPAIDPAVLARLRAVEHDRYVVVAGTVGISAMIAPDGRVLERTAFFEPAYLDAQLRLKSDLTPATRWGPIVQGLLVCVGVAAVAGAMLHNGRFVRRRKPVTDAADEGAT